MQMTLCVRMMMEPRNATLLLYPQTLAQTRKEMRVAREDLSPSSYVHDSIEILSVLMPENRFHSKQTLVQNSVYVFVL